VDEHSERVTATEFAKWTSIARGLPSLSSRSKGYRHGGLKVKVKITEFARLLGRELLGLDERSEEVDEHSESRQAERRVTVGWFRKRHHRIWSATLAPLAAFVRKAGSRGPLECGTA